MSVIESAQGLFYVDEEKVKRAKLHLMNAKLRDIRIQRIDEAVKAKSARKYFRAPVHELNHLIEIGIHDRKLLDQILEEADREFKITQPSARHVLKKQRETNRRNVTKSRMRNELFKKVMSLKLNRMVSNEDSMELLEREKVERFKDWMEFVQSNGRTPGRPTFWTYYTPVLLAEYKRLLEEKGYDATPLVEVYVSLVDGDS